MIAWLKNQHPWLRWGVIGALAYPLLIIFIFAVNRLSFSSGFSLLRQLSGSLTGVLAFLPSQLERAAVLLLYPDYIFAPQLTNALCSTENASIFIACQYFLPCRCSLWSSVLLPEGFCWSLLTEVP